MAFIELSNLSKVYGTTTVVENVNLSAEKGEFISFLGPSGCGKTTTLRMVAGFELPNTGNIVLDGTDITNLSPRDRNIGMVFQSYALFPNMTIGQNIGFGLQTRKLSKTEIKEKVAEMLALVHLESHIDKYPYQLSGGQQQRIALARALAINPAVLLLDEPLSALDAKIRVELRLEIRRIQQTMGITTIYVTHDQEEAMLLSDRVMVMSQGYVEQIGSPSMIYNHPATEFVAQFVGQLNLLPVSAVDLDAATCTVAEQTVHFETAAGREPGESPRLAIRPEELHIGLPATDEEVNVLRGEIASVLFLGAIVRLRVRVNDVFITADIFNERDLTFPRTGDEIVLNFSKHACWLI